MHRPPRILTAKDYHTPDRALSWQQAKEYVG